MGIIKKHSIQATILIYIGVAIGFLNSALLLPNLLNTEELGLMGFLNSLTVMFATIASLGIPMISLKLFPYFRSDQNKHNGFFVFVLLISLIGIAFGTAIYFIFEDQIISSKNAARYFNYFGLAFVVVFATRVLFKNIDSYVRMLYKTIFGVLVENIIVKGLLLALLIAYWVMGGFSYNWMFFLYSVTLASAGILLLFYLLTVEVSYDLKQFFNTARDHKKELFTVGLYGIFGSVGTAIVVELDRVMISNMIDLNANGIYTVGFFFGVFIGIPARGLRRIGAVVISESWKNNDLDNIQSIYAKSCINQLLISGYLLLGIWFCMDYLFEFMKPEYAAGKYVVLFIGIAQLVDMATGVNTEILQSSVKYRYNTYFVVALLILVVAFNYLMIPIWGINGAAVASLIAMTLVNALRTIYLYKQYQFQPFTKKFGITVILIGLLFGAFSLFPTFENPILGILITGSAITALYWSIALSLRLSDEINDTAFKLYRRFIK